MKVNRTWCVDEEFIPLLRETNASELINSLLEGHFSEENSEDEKILRAKYDTFRAEKTILLQKMRHISKKITQIKQKNDMEKQKLMDSKAKETRKLEVEDIQRRYQNDEITEEEYWSFFDK
jgi:hypothetical protein